MNGLSISRRSFLLGSVAVVAAPAVVQAVPTAPALPKIIGVDLGTDLGTTMWAVGSPDSFDWQPISASSLEEAFRIRFGEEYTRDEYGSHIEEYALHIPSWDGRAPEEIQPADWIDAELGHICFRCDNECFGGQNGYVVGADVVCEECMRIIDWVEIDEDRAVEAIAMIIIDNGEDDARQLIEAADAIPPEVWAKAVAEAAPRASQNFLKGKT
jgi:hypothetical protein